MQIIFSQALQFIKLQNIFRLSTYMNSYKEMNND